jgi:hypothetical protein
LDLIKSVGRSWLVGTDENPIKTYNSKDEALERLVVVQDLDVLEPLRLLVKEKIRKDASQYAFSVSDEEESFLAGEYEHPLDGEGEEPAVSTSDVDLLTDED